MTIGQRLRFLHRFARRDLSEPTAWPSTRANFFSTAIVTALTFAAIGVALGTSEMKHLGLENKPQTLCLWVGTPNESRFQEPFFGEFRQALGDRLGDGFRACYPFHVWSCSWLKAAPAGAGAAQEAIWEEFTGRTLVPGDPLLVSLEPLCGNQFLDEKAEGVIVTRAMLQTLGMKECPHPETLTIEFPIGRYPVPVVGVIDGLPNQQSFLMTESYFEDLRVNKRATIRTHTIESGPVPADWPRPESLKAARPGSPEAKFYSEMLQVLQREDYDVGLPTARTLPNGQVVWRFTSRREQPLEMRTWINLLQGARDALGVKAAYAPLFADLKQVGTVGRVQKSIPEKKDYEMAAIFVKKSEALPLALGVVNEFQVPIGKDAIPQLVTMDKATAKALVSCLLGAAVLLASSCVNLRVTQELRSELKIGEIGMLKAMGMDDGLLRDVFLYEAMLVWGAGTVVGLMVGIGLGVALSWLFIANTAAEIWVGFYCPWYLWLLPLVTGPTFAASTLRGIRRARQSAPIMILKTS